MSSSLGPVGDHDEPFAHLEVVAGPYRGHRYGLTQPVTVIGRESSSDISLNDALVSRRHAQIDFDGKEFWLTDFTSTNGTYVNDVRLSTPYRLREGDRIIMGNTVFVLSMAAVEHVTMAPPPAPSAAEDISPDDLGRVPAATEDGRTEGMTPRDPLPAVSSPLYPRAEGSQVSVDIESTVPLVVSNTFRLRVFVRDGAARLAVHEASRSPLETVFEKPFSDVEWPAILRQLEAASPSSLSAAAALHKRLGQQLYAALLPAGADPGSDVHQAFSLAAGEAHEEQGPLMLQLWFDADAAAETAWPWELVHDGASHLVLTDEVRLNRYIACFGRREPFEPTDELRVLLIVARPTDQDDLEHYTERDVVAQVLQEQAQIDGIHIGLLENPTFSSFKARLEAAQSLGMPYHIVHFDGHGNYFANYDASMLCFEDSKAHTQLIPAKKFAEALAESHVRLVLVSAASSGLGIDNTMLTTIGSALIRGGVPAAVGMQSVMPIDAIGAFAGGFYAALLRRESVSSAVARGRRAIAETETSATWFSPALYLRVADGEGYLFSEEPREHRRVRRVELTYLAAMWEQMSPERRAECAEGPLEIADL